MEGRKDKEKEKDKREITNRSRDKRSASLGAAMSIGKKRSSVDEPSDSRSVTTPSLDVLPSHARSSTALSIQACEVELSGATPSEQSSPGRESSTSPGRELALLAEERKRRQSGSPRRTFLISSNKGGSPRGGSPRENAGSKSPTGSAHSSPRSISSLINEETDALPVSKGEAAALVAAAQMRYHARLDPENLKREFKELSDEEAIELTKFNRLHGYTYMHAPGGGIRKYPIIVTGNIPFGARVFLVDFGAKLGEGANGVAYIGCMLQPEEKVAIKFLDENAIGIESILREANNLFVAGDFMGLYRGPFDLPHEFDVKERKNKFALIMRLAPGQLLSDQLYFVNQELKVHKSYKDRIDYYVAKKPISHSDGFEIAVAVIEALCVLHDQWLIHRDISCDNILIDKTAAGFKARFIDLDAAAKIGCTLMRVFALPDKKSLIKLGMTESIISQADSAYLRFEDRLFYLNRSHSLLEEVKLTPELLESFDQRLRPNVESRRLSQDELKTITAITGHAHLPPRYSGLNVAYGFAAPEFSREGPKIFSFESDYYMLGVLLVHVFSSSNMMQNVKEEFSKMMQRTGYHREELPVDKLKLMASDLFNDHFDYDCKRHTLSDYVFHHLILPLLRIHLDNLLADDPVARLRGSSLRELAAQLTELRKQFVRLSEGLTCIVDGLSAIQKMGVLLSGVLSIIEEFPLHRAKQSYFLGAVDRLLNLHEITSGLDDSADTIFTTLERVAKQGQRRLNLSSALNKVLKGWGAIKNDPPQFSLIKPLIDALCPSGEEAFQFLQKLPSAVASQERIEQKEGVVMAKGLK